MKQEGIGLHMKSLCSVHVLCAVKAACRTAARGPIQKQAEQCVKPLLQATNRLLLDVAAGSNHSSLLSR
jgi:hypothetical protein